MRDDGLGGDAVRGDGVWSATLAGNAAGTLGQFRIVAFDGAGTSVSSVFPSGPVFAGAPAVSEVNLRWGDPVPFGTFTHIHSWTTTTVDGALGADGLDNTFRDTTLVHGNLRVIYNAGIRRKGSPFTGQADFAVTVPSDDLLLGSANRVYGLTGNGGEEATRMRTQIANWFTRRLKLPYLESHYIRFFRNGNPHGTVGEDLEQPSNNYAEGWFPDGPEGDLHKVAFWFEFRDDGGFDTTGADLGDYRNPDGRYNLSRYRWNWQPRPNGTTASDFTNFFALVSAANFRGTNYVSNLMNIADMDQWMRMFALDGCMGNWDTWGTGNAQNKYLYYQPGGRWRILPWDMDWALGFGDGPNRRLFDGNDGNVNTMFATPVFRRMAWRGYQTAVEGPFQSSEYQPQFAARSAALSFNLIPGVTSPQSIATYLDARRSFIEGQIRASDVQSFAITSNGGADFTSTTASVVVEGTAPFAAASIEVNGVPYPAEWIDLSRFRVLVPLTGSTNVLSIAGLDAAGNRIPGFADTVTVRYSGALERVQDFVVINELNYDSFVAGGSYIELFNRSTTTSFDLSGARLNGVGYTFPEGSLLAPGAYWVLARDRAAFSQVYGAGIPVFDEFPGSLDNGGERISLTFGAGTNEVLVTDVRYDNVLPWPTNAAGLGSSLQLLDPSRGSWRVANWFATATNAVDRVTPGRANAGSRTLAAFPGIWINEVLPAPAAGTTDNVGDREPYVELVNRGGNTVDLSTLFLTDSVTNLLAWNFPAGTFLAPGGFVTVWADGEPQESAAGIFHTPFRLNPTNGIVSLVRRQGIGSVPAVMDYVRWDQVPSGRSFGSVPDGEPRNRRVLYRPTPGGTNDAVFPAFQVTINEFMAQNTSTLVDPADGDFDDWFELHNAGTNTVDLTGFYLTDRLTNSVSAMYRIPGGYPIPAGGFLLVWADGETGQNSPTNAGLHASFSLSRNGEQLGLFDPSGLLVDGFTFGVQTNDVSLGHFPDGAVPLLYAMQTPSPGSANQLDGANRPPTVPPVPARTVAEQTPVGFTVTATDPDAGQSLTYLLGPDAPAGATLDSGSGEFRWTPSELDGPASYSFLIRVSDNGTPVRTSSTRVSVTVTESNRPPVVVSTNVPAAEGVLLSLDLVATDPDFPANTLRFELVGAVPAGLSLSPSGNLRWIPDESAGGSVPVVGFRVVDDGVPALETAGEVRITVAEVNNPPVFPPLTPQVVDEGSTLTLQLAATDPELAGIRYTIDGSAPAGFQLDPNTGAIRWTPTEDQGPGSAVILIRASEVSSGGLSTVRELSVQVREVNLPPVLGALPEITVREGDTVTFTATATDPDRPAQQLRFDLGPEAPSGASLDPLTGAFRWVVPEDSGASTNTIAIRVTDDGPGLLGDTRNLRIVVQPRFRVAINEVLRRPVAPDTAFVELLNPSSRTAWDLSGLRLSGSNLNFTFPPGSVLAPGALTVVAANPTAFRTAFGGTATIAGNWTGSLGPDSDSLRLIRPGLAGAADEVLDRVDYDGLQPWPSSAAPSASSLQLVDVRRDHNRAGNWASAAGFLGARTVLGYTNVWRYFQNGTPVGNWREAAFNDSNWPQGGGLLFVESADLPTNKTTALTLGQTTYYFRTKVFVPALPPGVSLRVSTILDDGYTLWINGQRAHFLGMEDGVPAADAFANRTVGDAVIEGPFLLPSTALVAGENTFAVEVHQANVGSSDIVFGLELVLEGGVVSPATPGLVNNVTAGLPEFPTLRINEVAALNPDGLRDSSGTAEPWIELVNTGAAAVSLEGLGLALEGAGRAPSNFPAGSGIPPGGFLVVFADGEPAQSTASEPHAGFRLPTEAGMPVRLTLVRTVNGQDNAVDYFHTTVPALAGRTTGHVPDGEIASEESLVPSPGASNSGAPANRPPVFTAVADPAIEFPSALSMVLAATDPDAGQALEYSLVSGPAGLTVSRTGAVEWLPLVAQAPSTNEVSVRVVDTGVPPLSATNRFRVLVRVAPPAGPRMELPEFGSDGLVRFRVQARPGRQYRIEQGSVLGQWSTLGEFTAASASAVVVDQPPVTGNRFYRILELP
jgi:hypothetical protein